MKSRLDPKNEEVGLDQLRSEGHPVDEADVARLDPDSRAKAPAGDAA